MLPPFWIFDLHGCTHLCTYELNIVCHDRSCWVSWPCLFSNKHARASTGGTDIISDAVCAQDMGFSLFD